VDQAVTLDLGFDLALATALVGGAAVIVRAADTLTATALFIVFGVLMSVAWARLGAVDIALAEAAIGAGITGALLLHAQGIEGAPPTRASRRPRRGQPLTMRVVAAVAAALLSAALVIALAAAPAELRGLGPEVDRWRGDAGAENPVTAVLLNVRAHDTLLELVVLLAAVIAAWGLALPRPPAPPPAGLLLAAMTRVVAPVTVLIGGYLLWRGAVAPGGAFQAGAVIAGAGILCALAGVQAPKRGAQRLHRVGLVAGIVVFLIAGASGTMRGDPFLTYRGDAAQRWIVAIEVAATISIALALLAVFVGRPPDGTTRSRR
jgi:multisubunit Na+/H+ antiporter MnhB subunit